MPPSKSRWTGFGSEQPECVEHKRLQKNQYHINRGAKSPLDKVLKVLRKLSQTFSKQGSGQSPEVLLFLSGSGREARQQVAAAQIPLDGIWLGAAGNSSTANGCTKICTTKKQSPKSNWVKVLKVLKLDCSQSNFNFISRSFQAGLGTESQGLK